MVKQGEYRGYRYKIYKNVNFFMVFYVGYIEIPESSSAFNKDIDDFDVNLDVTWSALGNPQEEKEIWYVGTHVLSEKETDVKVEGLRFEGIESLEHKLFTIIDNII